MRPRLTALALVLLALTVAAPGIEAVAGCLVPCPEEGPGQSVCYSDLCCSCFVHSGPLSTWLPMPAPGLVAAGAPSPLADRSVPLAPPSDILHVPKPLAA